MGAGPGHFGRWLRRHRPRARLRSIDVSPYACARYGHERRDIARWRPRASFDLVVCHGVLQYLDDADAARAIENLGRVCRGLLYLEALTRRDLAVAVDPEATDTAVHARPGAWYRRRLERFFVQVGGGLWASRRSGIVLYELLTGCAPFEGDSKEAILEQVRLNDPAPGGAVFSGWAATLPAPAAADSALAAAPFLDVPLRVPF